MSNISWNIFEEKFNSMLRELKCDMLEEYLENNAKVFGIHKTNYNFLTVLDQNRTMNPEECEFISCFILNQLFDSEVSYKFKSTRFPDIIIENENLGFEIKRVTNLKNGTLGNSVLQDNPELTDIITIVFRGKISEGVLIKRYEDLITAIKVDHNPRFFLYLDNKTSFNEKFGMSMRSFLQLSLKDKSLFLKKYLRDNACQEDMWLWYMGLEDSEILELIADNIESRWLSLDKNEIIIKVFSDKPEILQQANYHELRKYIIKEFKCWGPIKDIFTAGGREPVNKLPKLFQHLLSNLPAIKERLNQNMADINCWKANMIKFINEKVGKPINANGIKKNQAQLLAKAISDL
jgi:hypothetical protein